MRPARAPGTPRLIGLPYGASSSFLQGPAEAIDLDGLDPAYAPGVGHHEPGGLATREVLAMVQDLRGDLVAADVVEYNPNRDVGDMTATVAAKIVKEVAARMLAEPTA